MMNHYQKYRTYTSNLRTFCLDGRILFLHILSDLLFCMSQKHLSEFLCSRFIHRSSKETGKIEGFYLQVGCGEGLKNSLYVIISSDSTRIFSAHLVYQILHMQHS